MLFRSLSPKHNFYQKVAFLAKPNAFFFQLFLICAFSAPKSANKRTLNVKQKYNRLHTINKKHVHKERKETTHGEIGERM